MKRAISLSGIACLVFTISLAQKATTQQFPETGKPCPDFLLKDVKYHTSQELSMKDLKGKWLVLDFWHRYCTGCIESMPKINSFQKKFGDKMQFIMIGYTGSQFMKKPDLELIKKDYEKYRSNFGLTFPVAFDSTLFHRFNIYGCPYIVIVDPGGIVRGITYRLQSEDIEKLLREEQTQLPKAWRKGENTIVYNDSLPFLINMNGGYATDYTYRSLLTPFKDYMDGQSLFRIINNHLQIIGVPLSTMYRYAYMGFDHVPFGDSVYNDYSPKLRLEIADPSLFTFDRHLRKNMFCYSTEFPASKANTASVMKIMQNDLQNYFGYMVTVEKRMIPVWHLVLCEKTAPGPVPTQNYLIRYNSVKDLLSTISNSFFPGEIDPIFDQTGLKEKVNGEFRCNTDNLNDIKRALNEIGFDLVRSEKEMKVIIIKDPQ